jgi:hypothetical protein
MDPTARSTTFKVKFTFGVAPLEQYRPAAGFLDRLGLAA